MTLSEKLAEVVGEELNAFREKHSEFSEEGNKDYNELVGELILFHNATMQLLGLNELAVTEEMVNNVTGGNE